MPITLIQHYTINAGAGENCETLAQGSKVPDFASARGRVIGEVGLLKQGSLIRLAVRYDEPIQRLIAQSLNQQALELALPGFRAQGPLVSYSFEFFRDLDELERFLNDSRDTRYRLGLLWISEMATSTTSADS